MRDVIMTTVCRHVQKININLTVVNNSLDFSTRLLTLLAGQLGSGTWLLVTIGLADKVRVSVRTTE